MPPTRVSCAFLGNAPGDRGYIPDTKVTKVLRQAADPAHLDELSYEQAVLPCSRGGVQLACADAICEAAFLAGVTSSLSYVAEHAAAYCLADANLSDTSTLQLFMELQAAHARWSSDSADSQTTLSHLLAGSPRKQNVLCGGLWDRRQAALLGVGEERKAPLPSGSVTATSIPKGLPGAR